MRNIFIDELIRAAKKNKKIILVVNDLGYSVIEKFAQKFPNQFFKGSNRYIRRKIDFKNLVLLLPKMPMNSHVGTGIKKATTVTLKPMSYQVIQQALSTLKEEHEKTIELNKKLQWPIQSFQCKL